jgi:hypothetical protein
MIGEQRNCNHTGIKSKLKKKTPNAINPNQNPEREHFKAAAAAAMSPSAASP